MDESWSITRNENVQRDARALTPSSQSRASDHHSERWFLLTIGTVVVAEAALLWMAL